MSNEWAVITILAAVFMATPKIITDRALQQVSLLLSFLFWTAAAYLWAVESTAQTLPIVYLHLAPMLVCIVWWMQDAALGLGTGKRNKYE